MNTKVPIIVGTNYAEGNFLIWVQVFVAFNITRLEITEQQYMILVKVAVPSQYLSSVLAFYEPIATSMGYWHALSKIVVSSLSILNLFIQRKPKNKNNREIWILSRERR